jgi:hypothetical protein
MHFKILYLWSDCGCNGQKHVAVHKMKKHLSSKDSQRFVVEATLAISVMDVTDVTVGAVKTFLIIF